MNLTIRPYQDEDFASVTSIWFEGWTSTGVIAVPPVDLSYLQDRLPKEIARGWIIHVAVGAELVAFVAMDGNCLAQLFVLPALCGRGIGKQLLDFVKAKYSAGFWLTSAVDNEASNRFYDREGLKRGEITTHSRFGFQLVRYDWVP